KRVLEGTRKAPPDTRGRAIRQPRPKAMEQLRPPMVRSSSLALAAKGEVYARDPVDPDPGGRRTAHFVRNRPCRYYANSRSPRTPARGRKRSDSGPGRPNSSL